MTELEETLLSTIDANVASADDNQLFAEGYLRGHISLAAADCESFGLKGSEALKNQIEKSLYEARSELSPADQTLVLDTWKQLSLVI